MSNLDWSKSYREYNRLSSSFPYHWMHIFDLQVRHKCTAVDAPSFVQSLNFILELKDYAVYDCPHNNHIFIHIPGSQVLGSSLDREANLNVAVVVHSPRTKKEVRFMPKILYVDRANGDLFTLYESQTDNVNLVIWHNGAGKMDGLKNDLSSKGIKFKSDFTSK